MGLIGFLLDARPAAGWTAQATLPLKQLDQAAMARLKRHRWPGNVRELENLARRLAALNPQKTITEAVIDCELAQATLSAAHTVARRKTLVGSVERHLAAYFATFDNELPPPGFYHGRGVVPAVVAGACCHPGYQIRAADLLGVNRNTLRRKIRDLDIRCFARAAKAWFSWPVHRRPRIVAIRQHCDIKASPAGQGPVPREGPRMAPMGV